MRYKFTGGKRPNRKRIFSLSDAQIAPKPAHVDRLAQERRRRAVQAPKTPYRTSFKRFWRKSPYRSNVEDHSPRAARRLSAKTLWKAIK